MRIETGEVESPLGPLLLCVREGRLCALGFENETAFTLKSLERRYGSIESHPLPRRALADRFADYFAGDFRSLDAIEVETGGTPFQRRVWDELRRIPAGETRSYARLAAQVGAPGAARAVGAANARNPVAIVIPCHRVIAADGSLCGFASGIERKQWLLDHERAPSAAPALFAIATRSRL
jgi:methylated-DNA-[protein]-cysteine S-methyltransferase